MIFIHIVEKVERKNMSVKQNNTRLTPKRKEFAEFRHNTSGQKKEKQTRTWRVWVFVIGLNVAGLLGAIYLRSKGIDVFALRGGK